MKCDKGIAEKMGEAFLNGVAFYLSLEEWEGISQTISGKGEGEDDTLL